LLNLKKVVPLPKGWYGTAFFGVWLINKKSLVMLAIQKVG